MNDRHPSGDFPADPAAEFSYTAHDMATYDQSPYGPYETGGYPTGSYGATGYDGWSTGSFDNIASPYGDGDPLFGSLPGSYDTGTYPAQGYGGWGGQGADAGIHDTGMWAGAGYQNTPFIPHQTGPEQADHGYPAAADGTAQWDVSAYDTTGWGAGNFGEYGDGSAYAGSTMQTPAYEAQPYQPYGADTYEPGAYDTSGYDTGAYDTSAYDTSAYDTGGYDAVPWQDAPGSEKPLHEDPGGEEQPADAYADYAAYEQPYEQPYDPQPAPDGYEIHEPSDGLAGGDGTGFPQPPHEYAPFGHPPEAEPEPGAAAQVPAHLILGRRRSPGSRRSALFAVAAPSVAVLGVAGIAAASVSTDTEEPVQAAPDTSGVQPSAANSKLDTQLAGLSEDADDFANRASRTQERIDLKKRQEAERKRKAAEAARREALRPKFAVPVDGTGISAGFGQAGINWMSVHTGVDFPVDYGTPVKAATDGTVTTKWDLSYGNMIVLTAADGTETWYCHLSSTRIRSGSVQAGDVIGYSGNSGNSTGPHLHFEVRPGGGDAIDPLPWFRSHGLEP